MCFIYISVRNHLASQIRTDGAHMEAVKKVSLTEDHSQIHFWPHEELQVFSTGSQTGAGLSLILILHFERVSVR